MTRPTFAEAHEALAARLSAGSLAHCERVADAARTIAAAYGVDTDDAALAGLLHDWSRDADDETLLVDAERYGLSMNAIDHSRPYLMHARVAAEQVRDRFPGIAPEVLEAIESHTLGGVAMSELAKTVYVADAVEAARTWDGVDSMRGAVGKVTLDELVIRALQHTLAHLVDKRRRVHPRAVDAWNAMVDVSLP